MIYSCCTSIDKYDLLADKGYGRIILSGSDVYHMDDATFKKVGGILADKRVICRALNSFCTPDLKLCGDGYDAKKVDDYIKVLAKRSAELGIKYIGIGSPKSRNIPTGFSKKTAVKQLKESLGLICDECMRYEIDVLLEAVCDLECNFITTTDEARELIEDMGRENLHMVYDIYHAYMMNEDDKPLRRAIDYIKLIHTAHDIAGKRHYLRRDDIDEQSIYFDTLMNCGFDGEVSIEAFYDNIEEQLDESLLILKMLSKKE